MSRRISRISPASCPAVSRSTASPAWRRWVSKPAWPTPTPPCAPRGRRCSAPTRSCARPDHHHHRRSSSFSKNIRQVAKSPGRQNPLPMPSVILFAAGSPLIVDYQESCDRCGWRILAAVRNVPGLVFVSDDVPLIEASPALRLDQPVLLPLFTPGNRRHAHAHAVSFGASVFPVLLDPTSI